MGCSRFGWNGTNRFVVRSKLFKLQLATQTKTSHTPNVGVVSLNDEILRSEMALWRPIILRQSSPHHCKVADSGSKGGDDLKWNSE